METFDEFTFQSSEVGDIASQVLEGALYQVKTKGKVVPVLNLST
jgi:translation elongation factor P/translation initiation factor 5A